MIEDVLRYPHGGVRERYRRLEWSAGRGHSMKERLVRVGWLEQELVPVGQSRKMMLRLTKTARRSLGLKDGDQLRGSIAHEYWKGFYARLLKKQGYRIELEAPRIGGRVDVLARNGTGTIAVEVETGKSDVVRNVMNGLRSRFNRVLVIATNPNALAKIEQVLAETGLLIAGRVETVLRDGLRSAA